MTKDSIAPTRVPSLKTALIAGGIAGTAVDTALFPLDTIKTRLQSRQGFNAAGGFRGVYAGLGSAVLGSAPNAAIFFATYESSKKFFYSSFPNPDQSAPFIHMFSASLGEIAACTIRVPTDLMKQRLQANLHPSLISAITSTISADGILGFYRGYMTTVAREIPFTCLQFPLYEWLKKQWAKKKARVIEPWEAALCGSIAGGIAGGFTTPLDVVKTRIMLSGKQQIEKEYSGTIPTLRRILAEEGTGALFAGVGPRVVWISVGGCIFLGMYEKSLKTLGG